MKVRAFSLSELPSIDTNLLSSPSHLDLRPLPRYRRRHVQRGWDDDFLVGREVRVVEWLAGLTGFALSQLDWVFQ
jgi:hypothetical protein